MSQRRHCPSLHRGLEGHILLTFGWFISACLPYDLSSYSNISIFRRVRTMGRSENETLWPGSDVRTSDRGNDFFFHRKQKNKGCSRYGPGPGVTGSKPRQTLFTPWAEPSV
ncbi:hypothetical protein BDV19DRAFT_359889, partial [Aspergillus venezuelensis]